MPVEVLNENVQVRPSGALVWNTQSTPWWDVPSMTEEGWIRYEVPQVTEKMAWARVVRVKHGSHEQWEEQESLWMEEIR